MCTKELKKWIFLEIKMLNSNLYLIRFITPKNIIFPFSFFPFYIINSIWKVKLEKNINSNNLRNETNIKGKNITLNFKVAPKHNYSFEVFNTHEVYGNTWWFYEILSDTNALSLFFQEVIGYWKKITKTNMLKHIINTYMY